MIGTDLQAFATALPQRGRLAGLDVGSKTIGVGLCDARWTIASADQTLRRSKFTTDAQTLTALFAAQKVEGLVIGLPLSMDGRDTPQTQSVRGFARNLAGVITLPILLWDERWSTAAVTRTLIDADASRARRAEVVDKMAAAYILQGAIDGLRNSALNQTSGGAD